MRNKIYFYIIVGFFQNYVNAHPDIVVLDPVPNVQKLLDRHTQYKMATKANSKANRLSMEDGECGLHYVSRPTHRLMIFGRPFLAQYFFNAKVITFQ